MDVTCASGISVYFSVDFECLNRAISRVCLVGQMSIGFIDVVETNEDLGVFDELAAFGKPKGKTVLPYNQLGSCYQRLEDFSE